MGSETLNFNFTYDPDTEKLGCLDINGDFIPFSSGGGIDTSDATAYAKNIEAGYTAYCRGEKITGTAAISQGIVYRYPANISLTYGVNNPAAAYVGSADYGWAIFAGGSGSDGTKNTVNAYSQNLVKSTSVADLSVARTGLSGATAGLNLADGASYALFTGGGDKKVHAYNKNLVYSNSNTISEARYSVAACSAGSYAIFAGGSTTDYPSFYRNKVEAFNSNLTRTIPTGLSETKTYVVAARITDANNLHYAMFVGGQLKNSTAGSTVAEYYNTSLTKSTASSMPDARIDFDGASVGNNNPKYTIFAGGYLNNGSSSSTYLSTTFGYNSSFTSFYSMVASYNRRSTCGASSNNYALFAGDYDYKPVDVYDSSLTRSTPTELSIQRTDMAATNIGNYVFFGGGHSTKSPYYCDTVDVFCEA